MAPRLQFYMVLWSIWLKPANSIGTRAVPQAWRAGVEQGAALALDIPRLAGMAG